MENDKLFRGMTHAEDLKRFRLPSPSPPLLTADLKWVVSYFGGLSEGSKVSLHESGLTEGSSVTVVCEVNPG